MDGLVFFLEHDQVLRSEPLQTSANLVEPDPVRVASSSSSIGNSSVARSATSTERSGPERATGTPPSDAPPDASGTTSTKWGRD